MGSYLQIQFVIAVFDRELSASPKLGKWIWVDKGKGIRFVNREDAELVIKAIPTYVGLEPKVEAREAIIAIEGGGDDGS